VVAEVEACIRSPPGVVQTDPDDDGND